MRKLLLALLSISLASCATMKEVNERNIRWYKENTSEFNRDDVNRYFHDETAIVYTIAGWEQIPIPPKDGDWKPFVEAGISYTHDRCTRYLESVFYFNRVRSISSSELSSTEVLTTALLQVAHAAQSLATIAAAGFDFGNHTINNLGNGLLYGLEPGTISKLVSDKQKPIEDEVKNGQFSNQAEAMSEVRRYAEVCLPVNIAATINEKLTENSGGNGDNKTADKGSSDKGAADAGAADKNPAGRANATANGSSSTPKDASVKAHP